MAVRTDTSYNLDLGIRLQSDHGNYCPGENIIGRVYRKSPIVTPFAVIKVSLHGRTAPRGEFEIIDVDPALSRPTELIGEHVTQQIYEGPLHIPQGGEELSWPFTITLPTHPDPRDIPYDVRNVPFTSISSGDVITQALPSTFKPSDSSYGYIDYFIKAEMHSTRKKSENTFQAILPFRLVNTSLDPPIVDFKLKRMVGFSCVRSDKLVPGLDKGTLSQRMKRFVSSSSLPTFISNLDADMPTVMQLDSPVPTPVMLRLVPDWNKSSESVRGLPPKVKLTTISMHIVAMTDYIEPTFSGRETTEDLKLGDSLKALGRDVYIPCTDEWPPVNVGQLLDLRISRSGRAVQRQGSHVQREVLHPSFATYNLRHTHVLRWKVQLDIAGENYTWMNRNPLTILEPSDQGGERSWGETGIEEQQGPSDGMGGGPLKEDVEDVPPPSFEEAVIEGAGR